MSPPTNETQSKLDVEQALAKGVSPHPEVDAHTSDMIGGRPKSRRPDKPEYKVAAAKFDTSELLVEAGTPT